MRILVVTNHFFPESFRINDIAFEMQKRGHEVRVLTAIPDYPEGRFHKGYSLFRKRHTFENGVEIIRYPIIPRHGGSSVWMVLNYLSGTVCGSFYGFLLGISGKFDCVFVHDTSPAFISIPAQIAACMHKVPIYHWVLDLWPESLVAGGINGGRVYSMIERMMKGIFKRDTQIMVSSHSIGNLIAGRGVITSKISYLPNWSDKVDAIHGVSVPTLPDGFIIMFAGNIGEAQNIENILQAARLTGDEKKIHWVFVGDGRKKVWADNFIAENDLTDTVHMLGRYPIGMMPAFFERADAMLVSLCDTPIFNITVPAKLQAYMAASKPVFAVLKGEGAEIIADADCGWTADPSSPGDIALTARRIASYGCDVLAERGRKAGDYYKEHFDRGLCMDEVERIINSGSRQ